MQYASDATMTIVFTCSQPSLVVFYDTMQGIHSVWALRKVTSDVSVQGGHVENSNGKFCLLSSQHSVPCFHQERSAVLPHPADPVGMPLGLIAPGFMTSHLRKISCPESAVGSGAYGLGTGTGSGCAALLINDNPFLNFCQNFDSKEELAVLCCCVAPILMYVFDCSALHSHPTRLATLSPGLHSRAHSPISSMAALR